MPRNFLIPLFLALAATTIAASAANVKCHLVNRTGGTLHVTIQGVESGFYETLELKPGGAIDITVPDDIRLGLDARRVDTKVRICRYEARHASSRPWSAEVTTGPSDDCLVRRLPW